MDLAMKMPDLSAISETVKVVRWLVEVGKPLARGEPILEVETDKAVMIVESAVHGTLKSQAVLAGEVVPAGAVIAVFDVEGKAADPVAPAVDVPPVSQGTSETSTWSPTSSVGTRSMFARNREAAGRSRSEPESPSATGGDRSE